ncbi:hypothetical protein E9993_04745 [Labilibacter sediminis]|nr:hypothetical protein E9993_04745 [Labilibacter sediminis]
MKKKLFALISIFSAINFNVNSQVINHSKWDIQKFNEACYIDINQIENGTKHFNKITYNLNDGENANQIGWVSLITDFTDEIKFNKNPLVFNLKANSNDYIEFKFIDINGSIFGKKLLLKDEFKDWTKIVIYPNNIEYWWGGEDDVLDNLKSFEIAISGTGAGNIWIDKIHFDATMPKTFLPKAGPVIDSLSQHAGFGFFLRRDSVLIPENPKVLEYLKVIQDTSSPEQQLLPSMENNEVSTFNNALVAMAFIVKEEYERAERILDYYSLATKKNNKIQNLQNFFYKKEARGFYQFTNIYEEKGILPYYNRDNSSRWMGDNAWLLIAFLHHKKATQSQKYDKMIGLLQDLLIDWYIDEGEQGGYVGHGWRNGDQKLHEGFGHPEGNIDAYAVMKLLDKKEYADKISVWLDKQINGVNLPLDLYTWRVLAYGKEYAHLLNIPEYDFRFRKIVKVNNQKAMGFYHGPDINMNNIWLDGTGHIACAYITCGDKYRGYFYANQLDKFLINQTIEGVETCSLPYTFNKEGGYEWVEPDRGFVSVAAWYIFAKNEFNPMLLNYNKM